MKLKLLQNTFVSRLVIAILQKKFDFIKNVVASSVAQPLWSSDRLNIAAVKEQVQGGWTKPHRRSYTDF